MALFYFGGYSGDIMIAKILVTIAVLSGAMLTVILNTTIPSRAGAMVILSVFLLMYLLLLSLTTFVVYGVSRMYSLVARTFVTRRPVLGLTLKKSYYYSTIVALAQTIIISMQSIGGVGPYEFGLLLLLTFLGCVYVTKRAN